VEETRCVSKINSYNLTVEVILSVSFSGLSMSVTSGVCQRLPHTRWSGERGICIFIITEKVRVLVTGEEGIRCRCYRIVL